MFPPHIHVRHPSPVRGNCPDHLTFVAHPTQGVPGSMGTQGCGLITPIGGTGIIAATTGFDGEIHIPKDWIFVTGMESCMVATGVPQTLILDGGTTKVDGANPNVQDNAVLPDAATAIVVSSKLS